MLKRSPTEYGLPLLDLHFTHLAKAFLTAGVKRLPAVGMICAMKIFADSELPLVGMICTTKIFPDSELPSRLADG